MLSSPSVLTRPNLWSAIVQESMKVCAMTRSTASTLSDVCTSKTNWGFLIMLIQNRRGRLQRRQKHNRVSATLASMMLKDTVHYCISQLRPPSETSFPHHSLLPCTPILLLLNSQRWPSALDSLAVPPLEPTATPYLFVFQIWMVSGSAIP